MVFHAIESLPDVINGHRVIMYYIEGDTTSKLNLRDSVEVILEMLGKKNDDLIVFKVSKNTHQFTQFSELYKPEISGPIALFVINSEGIPLICEEVFEESDTHQVFCSICSYCQLNPVSPSEITKVIKGEPPEQACNSSPRDEPPLDSTVKNVKDSKEYFPSTSTVLQIRLPDGTKESQKFDKCAFLQEVYDFICKKFKIKDFDLKTYNRNVFSATDYEKTLEHLDLTPNGVIIVIYKNAVPFKNYGAISRMIQYTFSIFFFSFTSIFKYAHGLYYTLWNAFFSSGTGGSREIDNQTNAGGAKGSTHRVKKTTSRFGNIHTLRRSDDSDDENNRYNGNSTQQK